MRCERLRRYPEPMELHSLYQVPHDHRRWVDHLIRVSVTIAVGAMLPLKENPRIVDLSCGNGAIAKELGNIHNTGDVIVGDFAPGYKIQGPIEETVELVNNVDLFILSETLEHLDDPASVLKKIREKTNFLLMSTPDGEVGNANKEHVWAWDSEYIGELLRECGFNPLIHNTLDLRPAGFVYSYQIWACG
jgi:SAM-dependent methyltransferase